ncbi:MAG: Na+:solute symporter, partial [Paraglaciecola sp.]|nr:Na+:solute symporter [Paraglaciecola sp.]
MTLARNGKSMKSFFAAGGDVPWWISGLSLFMSFFSVGTFVVWGAIAYSDGLVSVSIQTTMAFSGFVIAFFIAPAWNRTGAMTVAEYIKDRLGAKTQKIYTFIFLFISLFSAGAFLYPVGKIIEVSTGLQLETAIIILGLLIIAYTTLGGLWAVLVTDVLQFIVLTAAVILVIPMAINEVGGVSNFLQKLPEGFTALKNQEYNLTFLFAFFIYNTVFIGGNWAYVQRFTSVSNPVKAKKVALLFGCLYLIAPLIWMIPPMIYRVLVPDLTTGDTENAYLLISQLVLPNGLLGLVLGAMVFATASSVNTTLNIASGVITNDIYKLIKPQSSQVQLMRVARLSTVLFGLSAIAIALSIKGMGGIVEVVLTVAALTGAPIYLPPIWTLFSKRQNGYSIVTTMILSLLINLFFNFLAPTLLDIELSRSEEMLLGVMTPLIFLTLFEFLLKPIPAVVKQMGINKDFSATVTTRSDSPEQNLSDDANFGRNIIFIGIFGIGLLIAVLGCVADKGAYITVFVGVIIAIPALIALKPINFVMSSKYISLLKSKNNH